MEERCLLESTELHNWLDRAECTVVSRPLRSCQGSLTPITANHLHKTFGQESDTGIHVNTSQLQVIGTTDLCKLPRQPTEPISHGTKFHTLRQKFPQSHSHNATRPSIIVLPTILDLVLLNHAIVCSR